MTDFLLTLGRLSLLGGLLAAVRLLLGPLLQGRVSAALGYYLWLPVLRRLCPPSGVGIPVPAPRALRPGRRSRAPPGQGPGGAPPGTCPWC